MIYIEKQIEIDYIIWDFWVLNEKCENCGYTTKITRHSVVGSCLRFRQTPALIKQLNKCLGFD